MLSESHALMKAAFKKFFDDDGHAVDWDWGGGCVLVDAVFNIDELITALLALTPAPTPAREGAVSGIHEAGQRFLDAFDAAEDEGGWILRKQAIEAADEFRSALALTPTPPTAAGEPLGRFGHHPDPAIDFCVEVEELQGMAANRKLGFNTEPTLDERVAKAMLFRVGGDEGAVKAKELLRKIEASLTPTSDIEHEISLGDLRALLDKIERYEAAFKEIASHADRMSIQTKPHAEACRIARNALEGRE
jgi:hypothetical protein